MARKGSITLTTVGLLAGVAIWFALDVERRQQILEQLEAASSRVTGAISEYRQRLGDAIDAGRQAAEEREQQLESLMTDKPAAKGKAPKPTA